MFEAAVWVLSGAFVGWIYSLSEFRKQRSTMSEVAAGAAGGLLGGFLAWVFSRDTAEWNSLRILASIIFAISVIALTRVVKK